MNAVVCSSSPKCWTSAARGSTRGQRPAVCRERPCADRSVLASDGALRRRRRGIPPSPGGGHVLLERQRAHSVCPGADVGVTRPTCRSAGGLWLDQKRG